MGAGAHQGRSNLLPGYLAAGRQGPRRLVGPCADAALHGRHGQVQPHRAAQPVGPVQTESAQPDSWGSAVQERMLGTTGMSGLSRMPASTAVPGTRVCRIRPSRAGPPCGSAHWLFERLPFRTAQPYGSCAPRQIQEGLGSFINWGSGFWTMYKNRTIGHRRSAAGEPTPTASRARSSRTRLPECPCLECLGLMYLTTAATRRHAAGCSGLGQLPGFRLAAVPPSVPQLTCGALLPLKLFLHACLVRLTGTRRAIETCPGRQTSARSGQLRRPQPAGLASSRDLVPAPAFLSAAGQAGVHEKARSDTVPSRGNP